MEILSRILDLIFISIVISVISIMVHFLGILGFFAGIGIVVCILCFLYIFDCFIGWLKYGEFKPITDDYKRRDK